MGPTVDGLITLARLIQEAGGRNRLSQVESLEALDEKVANPGWRHSLSRQLSPLTTTLTVGSSVGPQTSKTGPATV